MKFKWFLIFEAVVCFLLGMSGMNLASGLITFPFAGIAQVLRMMSLSGGLGNAAAIVIYGLIGIVPLLILAFSLRKREFSPEDVLLPVLSLLVFLITDLKELLIQNTLSTVSLVTYISTSSLLETTAITMVTQSLS